ncbi:hypothetical protein JOH51_001640 [Rhizobium leguminosarum]|nr:hypothetical protein [Rhizobium leguminosarum]
MEQVAVAVTGKVKVVKVNIYENPNLYINGGISTLKIFKNGDVFSVEADSIDLDKPEEAKTEIVNSIFRQLNNSAD